MQNIFYLNNLLTFVSMGHIEKYKRLTTAVKARTIAAYLNKNGYIPATARKFTPQNLANSYRNESTHKDFVDGINAMYEEYVGIIPVV